VNVGRDKELVLVNRPPKNTTDDWKRQKEKLREQLAQKGSSSMRHRKEQFPQLEEALHVWVTQMTSRGMPLTGKMVLEQGRRF
jgi:hypothetical protein